MASKKKGNKKKKLTGAAARRSNARFAGNLRRQAIRDAGMDPGEVYDK